MNSLLRNSLFYYSKTKSLSFALQQWTLNALFSFDAVFSVFLFHEVPSKDRKEILQDSLRVLKKGGFLGFVDSIQNGDAQSLDGFLDGFPENFHEPYYRNYIQTPMKDLFEELSDSPYLEQVGLFSKVGFSTK